MKTILYVLIFLTSPSILLSAIIYAGPADFRDILPVLQPGDTLYLVPGNYTQSLRIIDISGTQQQPILIGGQPGMAKPVFLGNNCCNTVSLTQSSFLHLKDIICDGQNLVGIDALKAEGSPGNWTHHIEIEGLEIYNYGADQQNAGISTKCPSWNWWIHHNIIEAAGTGMYLGNSDGEQPFVSGLIEYNLIINTVGYNCQIKHQNINSRNLMLGVPGNGITVIRYNVFCKEQNASTGNLARPNLLVGNFPATGPGSTDYYDIYGNFFFQNPVEALFQGTGNLGFYNNVLYNDAGGLGVSIQTHEGFQPRDIDLFFNTIVVNGGSGISVSGVNASYTQRVWANTAFATNPISGGDQLQNITGSFIQAVNYLNNPALPLSNLDLSPLVNALSIAGINLSTFSKYQNPAFDFEGNSRDGSVAGAYSETIALWPLQLSIRTEVILDLVSANTQIFLESTGISIYPCPSTQYFQIEGLLTNYTLQILNVNGSVYQTLSPSSDLISVDIQSLPSGIFFVSVLNNTNSNLHVVAMIKQ